MLKSNEGSRLLWVMGLQGPLPRMATWGGGSIISRAPGKALCLPNYLQRPLVYAWSPRMVDKAFHSEMRLNVQRPPPTLEKRTVTYIHIQEEDDRLCFPRVFVPWKVLSGWKWWGGKEDRPRWGRGRAKTWTIRGSETDKCHLLHRLHLSLQGENSGGKKKKVTFLSFKITIKFISGEKNSKNAWKNGREAVLSLQLEQETRTLTSCGITVNPKPCWVKPSFPSPPPYTYTHLAKSRTQSKMLRQGHHCWTNGNYSRWSSLKMVYFFLHTFALYHLPQFGRKSLVFFACLNLGPSCETNLCFLCTVFIFISLGFSSLKSLQIIHLLPTIFPMHLS